MCPQRCISSSNLRAHRRRHLGVKKYEAKNKNVEQNLLVQVTETDGAILKEVAYELKDGENVLLLKHQDGDVYMV
ncbi:hypothetical protein B5X24_HaOG213223 [Helicoverpa armigera]|uniref:C2H2-type domain-containing protein n=1 Tax=Helicoverpa armigera TaxID=29058 RepID=A0A2W1BCD8_HELAM|nr:hypothetical protein B5X24_HaOG213223 [Helicoverpa armigera]